MNKSGLNLGNFGSGLGGGVKPLLGGAFSNQMLQKCEVPAELQGRTVKSILDEMEVKLELEVKQFNEQARQLARCNRAIYECLSLMMYLEKQIKAVEGAQNELSQAFIHFMDSNHDKISVINFAWISFQNKFILNIMILPLIVDWLEFFTPASDVVLRKNINCHSQNIIHS